MTIQRTDFPVFEGSYTRALGDPPVMLDGMEVVFDKVVGLAPVTLVPRSAKPTTDEARRD
jgi:hypothetical protein